MRSMAFRVSLLTIILLLVAACGTAVTPVWETPQNPPTAEHGAEGESTATEVSQQPTTAPTQVTAQEATAEVTAEATSEATQAAALPGDPDRGQTLFNTIQPLAGFACVQCHLTNSENTLIGPGLLNVAQRAASRVPGMSAEDYLRNSILHPSDFVVPGFADGLMPQNFAQIFSQRDVNDLISYLMTLTGQALAEETVEASAAPTEAATQAPTVATTEAPTAVPTEAPTQAPTVAPTEIPTEAATQAPTAVPTEAPTQAPTTVPTEAATAVPTEAATQGAAAPAGDPAIGEQIFNTFHAQAGFACSTCHHADSEETLIGPGLLGLPERAGSRVPGMTAEQYIRDSILHPSDFVVPGFPDGLMPQNFGQIFSDEDLNNLVAYLMTLHAPGGGGTSGAATSVPATSVPAATQAQAATATTAPVQATPTAAGSSGAAPQVNGDAAHGQELFNTFQAQAGFACATCHLPDSENTLIGPGLLNVGTRAATRIAGMSAVDYIRDSILHPSDFVVPGFPDGLMPQNFSQIFSDQDINDLIAYLLTLHN